MGALGLLLGDFLDAQASHFAIQFLTSRLNPYENYLNLTFRKVFLTPRCRAVGTLCN